MADTKEIVITRIFDAPRELVWKAWTEPKLIERWFGPEGFATRVEKSELKKGGTLRYVMIGPDGKEYPSEGIILEIVNQEKIIVTDEFGEDLKQKNPDLPQGMVQHQTFEDLGKKTKVTIRIIHPRIEDKKKHEAMGVIGGWNSCLDKLVRLLEDIK